MRGKSKDYPSLIKESINELLELERTQKHSRYRDYVRFVRYLKEGSSTTQLAAGERNRPQGPPEPSALAALQAGRAYGHAYLSF